MEKYRQIGLRDPLGITALVGPPGCGKSTLLRGLKMAAPYVRGFVFADMSGIMDWHRDPTIKSPLKDFYDYAKSDQNKGKLIHDTFTLAGFYEYLRRQQEELATRDPDNPTPFRHLVSSGIPRSPYQSEELIELCTNADGLHLRLVHIELSQEEANKNRLARIERGEARPDDDPGTFAERWDIYRATTHPIVVDFKEKYREQYVPIRFSRKIHYKAEDVVKRMDISHVAAVSLKAQIFMKPKGDREGSEAWAYFDGIENPQKNPAPEQLRHAPVSLAPSPFGGMSARATA